MPKRQIVPPSLPDSPCRKNLILVPVSPPSIRRLLSSLIRDASFIIPDRPRAATHVNMRADAQAPTAAGTTFKTRAAA
ncbi:hypothetical protein MY1884_000079, partial [Beauveria asiatica]